MSIFFMTTKKLPKQQIVDALNEVFNIEELLRNHYRVEGVKNRSDADLLDLCTRYRGKKIDLYTHSSPWDGGPILAFTLTFDDRYEICLLDGMNYCYKKFALCKELFHVVLSNPEFMTVNFGEVIEQCIVGGSLNGGASSEYVAEIAAMEYLFPYRDRLKIVATNYDLEEVSQAYRLPKLLVEQYLMKSRMDSLLVGYKDSSYASQL